LFMLFFITSFFILGLIHHTATTGIILQHGEKYHHTSFPSYTPQLPLLFISQKAHPPDRSYFTNQLTLQGIPENKFVSKLAEQHFFRFLKGGAVQPKGPTKYRIGEFHVQWYGTVHIVVQPLSPRHKEGWRILPLRDEAGFSSAATSL